MRSRASSTSTVAPGAGEVGGRGEAVVAGADDDRVPALVAGSRAHAPRSQERHRLPPFAASLAQRVSRARAREALRLARRQRCRHQRAGRRRQRIGCGVEEDVEIVARRRRRERELRLGLDALEPGVARQGDEVAVVESAEQVISRRAGRALASCSLRSRSMTAGHVVPPEIAGAIGAHPAVERLAERQPPTRAKHAAIFVEGAPGDLR